MASTRAVIGRDAGSRTAAYRMKEWIAARRALRVRALFCRTVSRWSRKSKITGASRSAEAQRARRFAEALLEVAEEQLEGVPVALHRSGAGASLVDQAAQEEVLDQLVEPDLGRSHGAPAGRRPANASKRWATMLISSGTAERYQ